MKEKKIRTTLPSAVRCFPKRIQTRLAFIYITHTLSVQPDDLRGDTGRDEVDGGEFFEEWSLTFGSRTLQ